MSATARPVIIFCLLSVLIATPVPAQQNDAPPRSLTIDAAVAYALSHNRAYKAATEDVAVAGQKLRQAQADFFPKIDSGYTFRQLSDQPVAIIGATVFPFNLKTSNRWEVSLIQPLFTGFGLESQYRASKVGKQISQYQKDETRLNLVRDVRASYLQTLLAQKLVEVARDNVESLQVQKRNAEALRRQGLAAVNDVMKAEVALSEAVQRERSTRKQLTILRSTLNQLLDIDLQARVELSEIEERAYTVPEIGELFAIADAQRPEYLAAIAAVKQSEYGKTAARSNYYPRLSAFAQYYREGEDFAADNNPYSNSDNAAVGVKIDWNLFEGGKTRAAELEWEHRRRAQEQRRDELRQRIRLQVEDAFEQLKVAGQNIETTRTALSQAEENERITSIQYKEQTVIFLEVLNAQVFLAQSRADYYQSLYGYEIAKAELERAIATPVP
ncbi:MAG: TolC family protein [Desulfobacteraceae bacterium]|nr:TolC family protein [Desulfobacteraceae bacterium]